MITGFKDAPPGFDSHPTPGGLDPAIDPAGLHPGRTRLGWGNIPELPPSLRAQGPFVNDDQKPFGDFTSCTLPP